MRGFKGTSVNLHSAISTENSSHVPLAGAGQFVGEWIDVLGYSVAMVSVKTDVEGSLFIHFSNDTVETDSSLPYSIAANTNEVHRVVLTRKYFRVVIVNGAAAQSTLRLQTILGQFEPLVSAFNQSSQQDADATLVKAISDELLISSGLMSGYSIVNKFGYNSDVDSGSVPEDIWNGGGVYTGWATAAETVQVLSSSAADAAAGTGARTIRVTGLDANYAVQSETITLNGTTPVNGVLTFIRVHTASIQTAGSGGVNAGTITVRQTTTTANVFLVLQIGRNQSNSSAYTVPAGYTAYMKSLHVACSRAAAVAIEGNIWTRTFGGVFRSRRPFFISDTFRLEDKIYGGLTFTEKSDLVIRINTVSANNIPVNAGYDLILVRN